MNPLRYLLPLSMLLASTVVLAHGPPTVPADPGPPDHVGRPDHAGPPTEGSPPARPSRPGAGGIPDFVATINRGRPDHAGPPGGPRPPHGNGGRGRPGAGQFTPLPGQSGASGVAHTRFATLDEQGEPIPDAAWARMTWFWIGPRMDFVLNGHELESTSDFVLIALPPEGDGEPGPALCLAEGSSNDDGHLHLLRSLELDAHIPADLDPASILDAESGAESPPGALLAIVSAAEVVCEEQDEGAPIANIDEGANTDLWVVSLRDVIYIDGDLLED